MAESPRSRRAVQAALFVTLAMVAAFMVSAIAGMGGDAVGGAAPDARTLGAGAAPPVVRVEVLNGAGATGLARDATHRLRDGGFDVVFYGNAARFDHPRSVVIDRAGDAARARAVAAALGIDSVATGLDPALLLDVSVVLGADWPPPEPARLSLPHRVRLLLTRRDSAP